MKLPCEKCGELIEYDGVSLPGQTCTHCGAKRPHTFKGSPLLLFLFFFGGWLVFGLINPLQWSDDSLLFASFGSLLVLVWFKVFLPIHLELWRNKRSLPMDKDAAKGRRALGCLSTGFLLGGGLSLFMFFATYEWPEEIYYDHTPTFELKGYPIFFDSSELPVHSLDAGPGTFPASSAIGERTKIEFVNRMEFPVRAHSVDQNRSTTPVAYLQPNFGSRTIDSYAGQTWLVTDEMGKPLVYFIAEKEKDGAIGVARILPDNREDR